MTLYWVGDPDPLVAEALAAARAPLPSLADAIRILDAAGCPVPASIRTPDRTIRVTAGR